MIILHHRCTDAIAGLAQIVGSLIMYGIGQNTSLAIAPWRVIFLVAGGVTIFAGILFYIAMPAGPANAWFFPNSRCLIVLLISIVPLVGCILLTVLPTDAGWGVIVASCQHP